VLLQSLVHNLLVGREMGAVRSVAEAHLRPPGGSEMGADDSTLALSAAMSTRVGAEAAAAAVLRMVRVASGAASPSRQDLCQPHGAGDREHPEGADTQGGHKRRRVDAADLVGPGSSGPGRAHPPSAARQAFDAYSGRADTVVKLASARSVPVRSLC